MDTSDSSVLRSLAVAFGDGLAFAVGMKLTHSTPTASGPPPLPQGMADRLARIEQRVERIERAPAGPPGSANLDPRVLEALTRALEARVQENAALMDRRLAELDVNLSLELKALRQQDQSFAAAAETRFEQMQKSIDEKTRTILLQVNEDRNALQNQLIALHREFASAVADIVQEQVATQLEERLGTMVELRLTSLVCGQMAPLAAELREEIRLSSAAKHREIADLRQRLVESDRNVLDVMLSTADLFRQVASRLGAPPSRAELSRPAAGPPADLATAPKPAPAPKPKPASPKTEPEIAPPDAAGRVNGTAPYPDDDLPGFAQPRKAAAAALSVPLVASFLVTAGCVAFLQYF